MSQPSKKSKTDAGKDSGLRKPEYNIVEAAKNNDNKLILEILKEEPKRINDKDTSTEMTALHWSAANINFELAEILFAQDNPPVDPFVPDRFGRYAFDLANDRGDPRVIDLFFKNLPDEQEDKIVEFDNSGGPDSTI